MQTTKDYILLKYGPLLSHNQVAELFGYSVPESLSNAISAGRIKLSKNGINRYHYLDVANAIDAIAICRPDTLATGPNGASAMFNQSALLSPQPRASRGRARKSTTLSRTAGREPENS
jgi:hypothetical protein